MRDLYSDDYDSLTGDGPDRLVPGSVRKVAGAAVFLGLIAVMGLWSYRLGTRDATAVPIVKAMEGPTRIQPGDPGGSTAAHQGLEVNSVLAGQPVPAPRHVAPAAAAPVVLTDEDGPQGELVVVAPVIASLSGADAKANPPVNEDQAGAAEEAPTRTIQNEVMQMVGAAASQDPAVADPVDVDAGAADARPKVRPVNLAPARSVPSEAKPVKTAAVAPTATAPTAGTAVREVSNPGAGARLVQLGAYDSEEIARQAWKQLVARQGDLLGSKSLFVERTTSNARVFYRLRVAGFETADQTRTMCEALRARGIDCIPVTLQ